MNRVIEKRKLIKGAVFNKGKRNTNVHMLEAYIQNLFVVSQKKVATQPQHDSNYV